MSSPNYSFRDKLLVSAFVLTPLSAAAILPPWLQHIRANATFEAAIYRMMDLPGVHVFFPRPSKESVAELNKLPATTALYSLRAHQEEQALDFTAAESDWKAFAAASPDNRIELADFYERRLEVKPKFTTLLEVANSPAPASEAFTAPAQQRSWQSFERALTLANNQSFDDATILALYKRWIARYPQQPTVYARAFTWALDQHRFPDAESFLGQYKTAFPTDQVFPIKATALLALKHVGPDAQQRALAVYDAAFQPLWPDALVSSYFSLLSDTHNLRHFLADANARLQKNPDDLNALGRIFLYNQNQSHTGAALAALDQYQRSKEARKGIWSATELDTLAQLTLAAHDAPDAARYDFALYSMTGNLPDGRVAKETGLSNMISLLLSTPEQPITLGAGNLSMYRDIATLDRGPGYWNGILSLWFNSQSPNNEFAEEEKKAQPYFQRAKAVELLTLLDRESPTAPQRAALHAQLLQVYADYGDNAAVIHEGSAFLDQFPNVDSTIRVSVAMTMADAYARQNDTASEFALYDRVLAELGTRAKNMPLSSVTFNPVPPPPAPSGADDSNAPPPAKPEAAPAFQLDMGAPASAQHPDADAYAQVLDRYLGRLTSAQKLPEALAVLRKELDRNPNDPLLYERLANFLDQNKLFAQQEEVYRQAIDKFPSETWTDKLARFYLRQKRTQDYAALTRKVTDTFDGTDVDEYFRHTAGGGGPELFVQLNLYAHQRFPHDIVFTQNLLDDYGYGKHRDPVAYEKLLRETWWQSPNLTRQFFELLSSTGRLESELAQLQPSAANPAAQEEAAEVQLWRSHFEESAPLFADLSAAYPADVAIGTTASDLQRSLAWFGASHTATSVAIEQRLLSANPGDLSRLARIGDILADHADDSAASLAPAAEYWRRMPTIEPGNRDGYLQAATIFWDYFQFDDALAEITAARAHFHQPALFGYEAGAIAEGKRDYPLAVHEYVAAALANDENSSSRLLQLARRPSTHDLVDSLTASAAASSPDTAALTLRLKVLTAQHRGSEAAPLLTGALRSAKTSDAAANIADLARANTLPTIYEQALARQADLTTDPIERLQLRYSLARAYEDRNDIAAASRLIDEIYKQDPLILGVVRSTVDFDWRTKHQRQAIMVLVAAAHASSAAQPELARSFTAEAAAKANESGDTAQARTLAESLLQLDPYNAEYLSLAADSYVRANDNAGLKQFYLARLDTLKTAAMSNDDRKSRTALLRKGLIPALTRAEDYDGAIAQYIALISAYPEDADLNNEAALYALRYNGKQQYIGFLQTTTKASPRDSRFFIDLASAQQVFADLPAAIDAYAHAIAIRKDRTDLYTAKASLEETLQRFDDAVADYQRLYQLTYKDPEWMVAIARVRARQGRAADAADALKTAYLSGPKQSADDFFQVASQLEQWNFLDDAARFAEQGRTAAGDHFLAADIPGVGSDDASTYARILTRQRHTEPLLANLHTAAAEALVSSASPTIIAAQVRSQGIASVTDSEWREQAAASHRKLAITGLVRALTATGATVDKFYTPEERAAYATQLDQQRAGVNFQQVSSIWIPAAHAAGLAEKESQWRKELMLSSDRTAGAQSMDYTTLQTSRMRFTDLVQALDAFLKLYPKSSGRVLSEEADAYRSAGDTASEMRVLRTLVTHHPDDATTRTRYLDLLLHHDTAALVAVAASRSDILADSATNFAVANGTSAVALAAINARGKALPAVWTPATTGLATLFFADTTGKGDTAFRTALASDATIADRLATKPDTAKQLTGELWFYYAGRDAQLRLLAPATRDSAEDLIAADLEYAPVAANYEALAQTYAEAGNTAAALAELGHVLELDPHSADTQDARALILWNAGRHDEAIASWRDALASLRIIEDRSAAPETFWTGFARIARRLHDKGIAAQFKPQMDDVLRVYIKRNGNYRSNELLHAAYAALPDADWIISLASNAVDPLAVLQDLDHSFWLTPAARETILLREIQLAQAAVPADAAAGDFSRSRLSNAQNALVTLYAAENENARALALLRSLDAGQRNTPDMQQTEIVLVARTGQLDALLADYRSHPDDAPAASVLRAAAGQLSSEKHPQPARALLEFAFEGSLATHTLAATDYLALADARLHTGDLAGALSLLHSLVQLPGDTYANLDSAAGLLENNSHPAEAIPFLTTLAHNVPWDLSYTARLAEAQQRVKDTAATAILSAVARNPLAPYALRTRTARELAGTAAPPDLGSGELKLLASGTIAPTASQQPFFVAARIAAAAQSHDPKQQVALLREAIAIAPGNQQVLLDLFRADIRSHDETAAHTVLETIFPTSAYAANDLSADAATNTSNTARLPPSAASLSVSERIQLAKDIADTYDRGGDSASAIAYLNAAVQLADAGPRRAALLSQIAAIEAAQRLEAANTARRPVIHKTLEQALTVRQRLTVAPDEVPPAPKEEE